MPRSQLTLAQLDQQAMVKIDHYVVLDSPEHKQLDDDIKSTHMVLEFGIRAHSLMVDVNGRVWSQPYNGVCHPLHFPLPDGRLIGLKIINQAAN